MKLCRRRFATFTIQFSVLEQENLTTSSWIVTDRQHSGNSFFSYHLPEKGHPHKFRRDKTISEFFYWKCIFCYAWTNVELTKCYLFSKLSLKSIHGRRRFHNLWSVFRTHISYCLQKIASNLFAVLWFYGRVTNWGLRWLSIQMGVIYCKILFVFIQTFSFCFLSILFFISIFIRF